MGIWVAFVILGMFALICLAGCVYFSWRLYIQGHSEHDVAILDEILKESYSYRPVMWQYLANVHIVFQGEHMERKISFAVRERLTESKLGEYQIPVVISVNRKGKKRVLVESTKAILAVLVALCGFGALMMVLPLLLVLIYN